MTTTLPKIWNTSKMLDTRNKRRIDCHIDRKKLDYIHEYGRGDVVSRQDAPDYIFFSLHDLPEKKKSVMLDIISIDNGLVVTSQAFHNLLSQFDLGDTQMFEVPLYEYDQKTRRPGTW